MKTLLPLHEKNKTDENLNVYNVVKIVCSLCKIKSTLLENLIATIFIYNLNDTIK